MESSSRNSNRTNSRNDGPLIALSEKIQALRFGLFYQYCNNPKCRELNLLVLPSPQEISDIERQAFQAIVDQADTPGMILEYPEEESVRITLIGQTYAIKDGSSWSDVLRLMHKRQLAHEQDSSNPECANYAHEPLPKGKWKSATDSTKFSNEVRSIPGVRHIDVDGIFHCPDCMIPLFLVEATSDGCPGTPMAGKFKATSMTKKLAKLLDATPLMVQHHYADDNHVHPVYLTSWVTGKEIRYTRTWDTLVNDFDNSLARHRKESCTQRVRNSQD